MLRWWNELGMIRKLNFARDRLVEGYFWAVGVYYEPSLSRARIMMAKMLALLTVLDDIYDSFGTLEELNFFTSIIQRYEFYVVQISYVVQMMQYADYQVFF